MVTSSGWVDYAAILADLRRRRDDLDAAIKAVDDIRQKFPEWDTARAPAPSAPTPKPVLAAGVAAVLTRPPAADSDVELPSARQHERFTPRAPKPPAERPDVLPCQAPGCMTRMKVGPRGPLPKFCGKHVDNRYREDPPDPESPDEKRRASEERIGATVALNRR